MTATVALPQPDEFAPYHAGYVARVNAPVVPSEALAAQADQMAAWLATLTDDEAMHRYAPDKWSIKQMIGHMADAEWVFGYRLLRICRHDTTPLPGFSEDSWVAAAAFDTQPVAALVDAWVTARWAATAMVRTFDDSVWARRGVVNGHPLSARALLYIMLGHVEHHRIILVDRYGMKAAR